MLKTVLNINYFTSFQATDRLKSEEELAREEKARLEKLEVSGQLFFLGI